MRNLIAGIVLGIAATLALGAATRDTGRYQIAATATDPAFAIIFRLDTQTGAIEVCRQTLGNVPQNTPIQIIQPK